MVVAAEMLPKLQLIALIDYFAEKRLDFIPVTFCPQLSLSRVCVPVVYRAFL